MIDISTLIPIECEENGNEKALCAKTQYKRSSSDRQDCRLIWYASNLIMTFPLRLVFYFLNKVVFNVK